ncbi:MAG: ORF6C domain-containing protein [Herpetosiphonaceae bacterium]|nr:ORF6C domain-containing protein [Herpetosiphonaceae bacterium]
MTDPLERRIVPFYGDELIAVQRTDSTIYVLFTRLCENLGLARRSQILRIQRHAVLTKGLVTLPVTTEGGPQEAQCLRLDLVPLWLSGLQAGRVKAEVQAKLVRYQEEVAVVLWQAFKPQMLVQPAGDAVGDGLALQQLQQIAEMGRAITRMAEQQIDLQRQQQALVQRLDGAARVIKDVQWHLSDVQVRLGVLEDQLQPASYVTDAQATEISNRVKALGELLTTQGPAKNHYQGIFAELYRRFGVSSYKTVQLEQYTAVLDFLEDWRVAAIPLPKVE